MSRGHGKWERAILEALEQGEAFYLLDLLAAHVPDWDQARSTRLVALRRAVRSLEAARKVRCFYDDGAHGRLVVARGAHLLP